METSMKTVIKTILFLVFGGVVWNGVQTTSANPTRPQSAVDAKPSQVEDGRNRIPVGDVKTTEQSKHQLRTALKRFRRALFVNSTLWSNGVIPYSVGGNIDGTKKNILLAAMKEWEKHTCLKFEERTAKDMVSISMYKRGMCSAEGGRVGGIQKIYLGEGCWTHKLILHMLGHTIGLWHEVIRPDRDDYVKIKMENVRHGYQDTFKKTTLDKMPRWLPYDLASIMHFEKTKLSKNGKPTIITLNPSANDVIGRGNHLSYMDIKAVNMYYNCKGNCKMTFRDCPFDAFVDSKCRCMCPMKGMQSPPEPCPVLKCYNHGLLNLQTYHCDCWAGFTGLECDKCTTRCKNGGTFNPVSCDCACNVTYNFGISCEKCVRPIPGYTCDIV